MSLKLRGYQLDTIDILKRMEKEKGRENFSTVINLPTGAGKSVVGAKYCAYVLSNPDTKVLWLADKNELLRQTKDNYFAKEYESVIQLMYANESLKDENDLGQVYFKPDTRIVFANIRSLTKLYQIKNDSFQQWVDSSQKSGRLVIVYDECHHIGEAQAQNLFTSLFCDRSIYLDAVTQFYNVKRFSLIGMTATLYRGDNFIDVFKGWFKDGYNKENDKLCHNDTDYGDYWTPEIKTLDEIRVAVVDIKDLQEGEQPKLLVPDLIRVDDFNGFKVDKSTYDIQMKYLANRLKDNYEGWGKTAVIVNDIDYAQKLAEYLKEGISEDKVFLCTSKEKASSKIMQGFKEAVSPAILIAVHIFDEGVDVPELDTIYLYAPTNSQNVLRQRVGRVLRKPESSEIKKHARVIWQKYDFDASKVLDTSVLDIDTKYITEKEDELDAEIKVYKSGKYRQIPAIAYKLPIPYDKAMSLSSWLLLRAEALFGSATLKEARSIGYFKDANNPDGDNEVIFVRRAERKGYEQYLQVLQNDWFTLLRNQECETFADYANILGLSEEELILDIKRVCFYMSNAEQTDTEGRKTAKRFRVNDSEIKEFFSWFMTGDIQYCPLNNKDSDETNDSKVRYKDDDIIDKSITGDKGDTQLIRKFDATSSELYELYQVICETESQQSSDLQKSGKKKSYSMKEYTDLLLYCNGRYNYYEVQSMKSIMAMGAVDVIPRVLEKELFGVISKKSRVPYRLCRTKLDKKKWWLMATALVDIPNHIKVSVEDVDEYEQKLLKAIQTKVKPEEQEQAVKESLLALGYVDNDGIIAKECEWFGDELPAIVQYVIYQKVYRKLVEIITFQDEDLVFHSDCQNKENLEDEYKKCLAIYGITEQQITLSPVEDVINDYRPYLKAVPYYQGIKPEFLCRMANDLVRLSSDDIGIVVDSFGGSGTCSMNGHIKGVEVSRVYNDLGYMNTAFYQCIQDDVKLFAEAIQSIIDDAFTSHSDEYRIDYIESKFKDYALAELKQRLKDLEKSMKQANAEKDTKKADAEIKFIETKVSKYEAEISAIEKKIQIIESSVKDLEERYSDKYKQNVEECRKTENWQKERTYRAVWLENRLQALHNLDEKYDNSANYVERFFHVFMLKVNILYDLIQSEMDDEVFTTKKMKYGFDKLDLAVLFFFFNTLSHRHFYNGCTIQNIEDMLLNYHTWLMYGKECFDEIKVEREDALKLMLNGKYNEEQTCWYADIPYAETSSADYVAQWFENDTFIDRLSYLKGKYIVSSRCNICLPNKLKKEFMEVDNQQKELVEIDRFMPDKFIKELNVYSFFSGFLSEQDDISRFVDSIEIQSINPVNGEVSTRKIVTNHISHENEAKYILIPYTRMSEVITESEADSSEKGAEKYDVELQRNSSNITEDYVRRMIAATHYSNIPVDIMVTNIDIDLNSSDVRKTYNGAGVLSEDVYVMPTFKTGVDSSQYFTEPAVIIMRYAKFMEILSSLLYHDEWRDYKSSIETKSALEIFSNLLQGWEK